VHILGGGEEALLSALVAFIESKLIPVGGSHERKGVALKLTLELVRLVPTTLIPVVLSQRVVQCLVSIRGNPKHTLFDLAGATLQEIVRGAGDSSIGDSGAAMCRLAIANAFVLHGSAVFDNRTATSTVGELLQEDDEDEDVGEGSVTSAVAAVNALYALAKNSRIANRGSVCSVVMAVFIRLACFGPGSTVPVEAESRGTKKPKKKSKAKDIQSIFTEWHIDSDLADKIVATVHHIEKNPDMSSYLETTASGESVAATAGSRLLALLADMGHMSVLQLNEESAENGQEGVNGTPGVSLLHVATATLLHIACSIRLRVDFAGENVEGSAGGGCVQELRLALMALQSLVDSPGVPPRL
ncbi:100787296, partial [Symbiodinium microadriaticum]